MKKLAIIIISALIINLGLITTPLVFAANDALSEATFPVREILKLKDNVEIGEYEQQQAYFKEENANSPIVEFILQIINYFVAIISSFALILLIISGFMMMFAQGNQQKLDEAKDIFKYAIIGLLVTFLAYVIVIFVQSIFVSKAAV
ncbi:MAG: pilin [bacterium]|nr:pilin [bacterium]